MHQARLGSPAAYGSSLAFHPQGYGANPSAGYPGYAAGSCGSLPPSRSTIPPRAPQQYAVPASTAAPRLTPGGWGSPPSVPTSSNLAGPSSQYSRRGSFGLGSSSPTGSSPTGPPGSSVNFGGMSPQASNDSGSCGAPSGGSLVFSQPQAAPTQSNIDKTGSRMRFNNGGSSVRFASSDLAPARSVSPNHVSDAPVSKPRTTRRSTIRRASDLGELKSLYEKFDRDRSGSISLLDFANTLKMDSKMAEMLVPGVQVQHVMNDDDTFDAVSSAFNQISGGKSRISFAHFSDHFNHGVPKSPYADAEIRVMFDAIDTASQGLVSKLQLLSAVQQNREVSNYVLPGLDTSVSPEDAQVFDAVSSLFDAIAGGKKRFDFADFAIYFSRVKAAPPSQMKVDRAHRRILIIGPGFGRELNPRQSAMIIQAGYQVRWCSNLPNPEQPGVNMMQFLPQIRAAIDEFQPDLVAAASKGGAYLIALWQTSYWRGPSLIINAHPTCRRMPEKTRIVLASGSNDEVYVGRSRAELEQLISTGSRNHCFLYYTANSGQLPSGHFGRMGDMHNMESLLMYDCLPRLIDAAMAEEGPEMHMMRSWRERMSEERTNAEAWLGHSPDELRRFWASAGRRGKDQRKLFAVQFGSQEFQAVESMFKSPPKELPAYCPDNYEAWEMRDILKIERVENGLQDDGSTRPYFDSMKRSIADQGIVFETGVHTRWAFHGTDAIDSIVSNPITGFQPLASGSKGSALWGSGTYFARDAKYVAEGGFCHRGPDGSYRMLMCLLMTGMPCLGGPEQRGVLPLRQGTHRYNSSVDSLSNPEIFVLQYAGAACPAYLISFL